MGPCPAMSLVEASRTRASAVLPGGMASPATTAQEQSTVAIEGLRTASRSRAPRRSSVAPATSAAAHSEMATAPGSLLPAASVRQDVAMAAASDPASTSRCTSIGWRARPSAAMAV